MVNSFLLFLLMSCFNSTKTDNRNNIEDNLNISDTRIDTSPVIFKELTYNFNDSIFLVMKKESYVLKDSAVGDLNGDKKNDFVYIFFNKEKAIINNNSPFSIVVFFGGNSNKFILRNDNIFRDDNESPDVVSNFFKKVTITNKQIVTEIQYLTDYNVIENMYFGYEKYVDNYNKVEDINQHHNTLVLKNFIINAIATAQSKDGEKVKFTLDISYKTDADLSKFNHGKIAQMVRDSVNLYLGN